MTSDIRKGPHISFSQINTYLMCSYKYMCTYVQKIEYPFTPVSLVFGTSIHEAIAYYYQAKLEGDVLKPEVLFEQFGKRWAEDEDKRQIQYQGDGDKESSLAMAEKLLNVFCERANPDETIIGIEEPFSLVICPEIPPLVGQIDLLTADEKGAIAVVDHKTAAKRKTDAELAGDMQMTCYSLGVKSLGYDEDVLLMFQVLLKQKTPAMERYYTTRNDRDRERLVKLIRAVYKAIQSEVFMPTPNYTCSTCPYKEPCSKW